VAAAAAATGAGSSSTAAAENVLLAPLESSISVSGDEVSIMTSDTLLGLELVRMPGGGLGILLIIYPKPPYSLDIDVLPS
jgi:hypothetical protein